jgi:hypothetical protein
VLVVVAALAVVLVRHYTSTRYIQGQLARSIARSTEHLYRIRIGSSDVSLRRHSLKLSDVELLPDPAEVESRIQNGRLPATRMAFTANSLTFEGVDFWALVRGGLVARSAAIDSPRVIVHLDRKIAALGGPTRSHKMPHEVLAATRRAIRIDTLRVAHGDVRYSELALAGVRPGSIRFADLSLTAYNITNRRDPKRRPIPAVAQIHFLLAGAAPSELNIAYDLFSPALRLTYDGNRGEDGRPGIQRDPPRPRGLSRETRPTRFDAISICTPTSSGFWRRLSVRNFRDRPVQPLHLSACVFTRTCEGSASDAEGAGYSAGYRISSDCRHEALVHPEQQPKGPAQHHDRGPRDDARHSTE